MLKTNNICKNLKVANGKPWQYVRDIHFTAVMSKTSLKNMVATSSVANERQVHISTRKLQFSEERIVNLVC